MPKIKESTYEVKRKKKISEMDLEEAKAATKVLLDAQPKRMVMLNKKEGDVENAAEIITINGYPYVITKGIPVEVPESVAKIVETSNKGVDFESVLKKYKVDLETK